MRSKIILSIIAVVIVSSIAGVLYFYYYNNHMLVTKVQPSLSNVPSGQIATATTYIDFHFNKKINGSSIKTNSVFSDQNIISSVDVREQSIRVNIQSLVKDQKYSIYLQNIESTDGFVLSNYTYTVTATFIKNYNPTDEEKKLQNAQTDRNNNSDPIFAVVPFQTLDFSITAGGTITNSSTPPTIFIYIILTAADYNSPNPGQIIEAKRQLARNYLIAKGIDLNKYKIVYSQTPNNFAN